MTNHINQLQSSPGKVHFQKMVLEKDKLKSPCSSRQVEWGEGLYEFSLIFSMILWFGGRIY